jgi:hypothetical protein
MSFLFEDYMTLFLEVKLCFFVVIVDSAYLDTDSKHLFHSWILHMIQMNYKKSRKFFSYHVFSVFFIQRVSNKVFIQIQKIKKRFKMIMRAIFAIVLIGLSVDLIATQGLYQVLFFPCQN